MKRDWNLIRDIMQAIEEDRFAVFVEHAGNNEDWQDGLDSDQIKKERMSRLIRIDGHVRLLIEANLINKVNSGIIDIDEYRERNGASPKHRYQYNYKSLRLSMEGHDLLDHMREPKVWNLIKKHAEEAGSKLTLDFIRTAIPKILSGLWS